MHLNFNIQLVGQTIELKQMCLLIITFDEFICNYILRKFFNASFSYYNNKLENIVKSLIKFMTNTF